jgi:hypothetical protein
MRDQWNMPLWLGESGENSNDWFRNVVRCAEAVNLGWSWWPWKKLKSVVGPITVTEPAGYQSILNYWRGNGPRPSATAAFDALLQLAQATRFENCTVHPDVFDALLRAETHSMTLPFKTNTIPGVLFAADYDIGASGEAYYDVTTNNSYNTGNAYRNDDADIQPCSDTSPSIAYNIGWLDPGDWMNYTVSPLIQGPYAISARVAAPSTGGSFYIEAGGVNASGTINVPATGGWQSWTTLPPRVLANTQSLNSFKLVVLSAGFNLNWLRLESLNSPALSVGFSNRQMVLSWPALSANFNLYSNTNLALPTWTPVTSPILTQNAALTIVLPADQSKRFFRLQNY